MSKKLLLHWLPALLSCLILTGTCFGEGFLEASPFVDPSTFDMDYQLFAPADINTFGDNPEPNTGFYFGYSRLNWSVSRAEVEQQDFDFDRAWGNRFDLGYMTEDDKGWAITIIGLNGPHNIYAIYNDPDNPDEAELHVNDMSFNSVSLDRVWRFRQKPCGQSCWVEPFVGARWMQVNDFVPRSFVINANGDVDPFGEIKAENNIFGGEIGVRCFGQKGRWVLSSEARFFGGYNWQYHDEEDMTHEYGMFVGDLRLDASFIITREVALTVGCQAIHMPFGVGRANSAQITSNEDLTMVGVTFGFVINR